MCMYIYYTVYILYTQIYCMYVYICINILSWVLYYIYIYIYIYILGVINDPHHKAIVVITGEGISLFS